MLRGLIILVAVLAGAVAVWISMAPTGALPVSTGLQDPVRLTSTTEVLVASIDLVPGSLVEPDSVRWQPWPQESLNAVFITRELRPDAVQALAGLVVRSGLIAGEPIHDAKLSVGDAGALSVMLASGKRAVAVRISAENSAGGFVLPNDRVDILLTTSRVDSSGRTGVSSRVILKNVKVLAVDQMIDGTDEAVVGKTATLELNPAQVETLTAAEASGALSLSLRSMSDNSEDTEVLTREKRTLRIFRGGQIEVIELD